MDYKFVRKINESSVEVEAKPKFVKCCDMQCAKCPLRFDYDLCMQIGVEDYLKEAFILIERGLDLAENGYEKKHLNAVKNSLNKSIKFSMDYAQFKTDNWKMADYMDTCTHQLKNGTMICNNKEENENE